MHILGILRNNANSVDLEFLEKNPIFLELEKEEGITLLLCFTKFG